MYGMLNERVIVIVLSNDGMVVSGQRTKQQTKGNKKAYASQLQNLTSQSRLWPATATLVSLDYFRPRECIGDRKFLKSETRHSALSLHY